MAPAERAVLATSQARELCLSLQRAFVGPSALETLRSGRANALGPAELGIALGLAWASGDMALLRATLATLPAARIARDPILSTFKDVSR